MSTIPNTIQAFRAYLQRRNYAVHTLDSYLLDLQLFFADCERSLAKITFREVDWFIDHQHHKGLASTTINRRLYALKHFFDFLVEQQLVDVNPVKPSQMLRRSRSLPKEQIDQLFAQIQHPLGSGQNRAKIYAKREVLMLS